MGGETHTDRLTNRKGSFPCDDFYKIMDFDLKKESIKHKDMKKRQDG